MGLHTQTSSNEARILQTSLFTHVHMENSVSSTVLFLISTCHPQNVRCGHLINKSKLAPSCHQITFLAKENATYALRVTSMFTQITLNTTMFIHYLLLMLIFFSDSNEQP